MHEKARKKQLHNRIGWRLVWQVIEQTASGKWTEEMAARYLHVVRSRVNVLKKRWLAWRDRDPSPDWLYPRRHTGRGFLPEAVRAYVEEEIKYYRQESPFFRGHINFAFLAQQCHQRYGRRIHRNTIRRWAIGQGLYDPKRETTGKPFVRFEKGGVGMLFQHDSSIHAWLPYTHEHSTLIMTEDDHSRKVVGWLLVDQDTSWNHLTTVRATLETVGCPLSYYVDNHIIFRHVDEVETQFARALRSVEVDVKFTAKRYPEAKGKIEKRFDYFQRRIPLLCERYKTKSLTEANKILTDEVAYYNEYHLHDETEEPPNKRWNRAVHEGRAYLRELPTRGKLDVLFSLHHRRRVDKCGQVWFEGRPYPATGARCGGHVTLAVRPPTGPRRPHTELFVLDDQGREIAHHVVTEPDEKGRGIVR
jgi:hypothetical protein